MTRCVSSRARRCQAARRLLVLLIAAGTCGAAVAAAQPPASPDAGPPKPAAAAVFEQTLAERGLEAALARLREILADTTEAYAVEPFELLRQVPNRLVLAHQLVEARELVQALGDAFGESPAYWPELANAHLRCGDEERARAALDKALALAPQRADLAWTREHVAQLAATMRLQAERETRFAPGQGTGLRGPNFGQAPPGRVPEVFAPGLVSTTAHEYHVSFGPDGRELVFSRGGVGTLVSRLGPDGWTAPQVVHLIDVEHQTEEANLTPDGRAVVFCGRKGLRSERVLYRAERDARSSTGWGAPARLFPGMYATSTLDGTLYYTETGQRPDYGVIARRRWTGGGYGEPEIVAGEGINSPAPDAHPFVAPDESLLLFDSYREPGAGIYASFRQPDGSWGAAVLLNEKLGIPPVGQCALSPDGQQLFFCLAGDLYWVDAGFLRELRERQERHEPGAP